MSRYPTLLMCSATLLAACTFNSSNQAFLDDGGPNETDANLVDATVTADATGDANADATAMVQCEDWSVDPALLDPCVDITIEMDQITLTDVGSYRYDTDTGVMTNPDGATVVHTNTLVGEARAIVLGRFELGAQSAFLAFGSRPLLIAAWEDIIINGEMDVSSTDLTSGAGANSTDCIAAEDGTSEDAGGGGGGGGAFGSAAGDGGDGRNGNNDGGLAGSAVATFGFRGGCPGGNGGIGDGNDTEIGIGGSGGGAIYLLARLALQVSTGAKVLAGGQGGGGALNNRAAGGGGGSGGLIGLEAGSIVLQSGAVLAANGGGGGGGGNNNPSQPGQEGQASALPATGGAGEQSPGGDGGNGGSLDVLLGQPGIDGDRGGGGGGGGVGHIHVSTPSLTNDAIGISPAFDSVSLTP